MESNLHSTSKNPQHHHTTHTTLGRKSRKSPRRSATFTCQCVRPPANTHACTHDLMTRQRNHPQKSGEKSSPKVWIITVTNREIIPKSLESDDESVRPPRQVTPMLASLSSPVGGSGSTMDSSKREHGGQRNTGHGRWSCLYTASLPRSCPCPPSLRGLTSPPLSQTSRHCL